MPSADGEPRLVKDEVNSTACVAMEECPAEGKEGTIAAKEATNADAQNNAPLSMAEAPAAVTAFATKEMLNAVEVAPTETSEAADVADAAESLSSTAMRSRADEQRLASTELSTTANNTSDHAEQASDVSQSCTTAMGASAFADALPAAESSAAAAASTATVAALSASGALVAAPVAAAAADQAAPPDGGWGWMVVFASFVIHIIIDGISYTFGVFMNAYAEHFDCGAAQASALMSTLLGVYMLSGPLASGLIRKFGSRAVGVAGSLLSAAAFIASTFSPNIEVMLLLYGVIGGIGLGLMYMPSVTSVGHYFDKKRTIAMGIAMSGTGFGTILFGQVGVLLLEVYDWKNTHYILAGILLNGAVFSSLIRPRRVRAAPNASKTATKCVTAAGATNSAGGSPVSCSISIQEASAPCDQRGISVNARHPATIQAGSLQLSRSVAVNSSSANWPISYRRNNLQRLRFVVRFVWLFYNGRVVNSTMADEPADEPAEQCEARLTERPTSGVVALVRKVIKIAATDLALFTDKAFLTVALASFLAQIAFVIPYGFTVEKAKEMGTSDEDAAFLLSYLGVANVVGLLGSSAIAQIPRMRTLPVHNVFLGIASLFMLMTPLSTNYPALIVCAAGYGLFIGGHVTLPPIFLCEILGLEKLNTSFGLLTLIRGVALFIGPILAGSIYDTMGSYDDAFYIGGSLALLSTLLFCLLFHKSVRYSTHKR